MPFLDRPDGAQLHYTIDDFTDAWTNCLPTSQR